MKLHRRLSIKNNEASSSLVLIIYLLCAFLFCGPGFFAPKAHAGFFEVGVSGSYRHSNIDKEAWDKAQSLTGSIAYNFDEMSAMELSYTDSISRRFIGSTTGNNHTTSVYAQYTGLDFILTLGDRESVVRPYIKLGGIYIIEKKIVDTIEPFAPTIKADHGIGVPSAGLGVRIALTKTLSLKAGGDIWASEPINAAGLKGDETVQFDYTGRMGLSWLF